MTNTPIRWGLALFALAGVSFAHLDLAHAQDKPAEKPADKPSGGPEYSLAATGLLITENGATRELGLPDCEPRAIAREGARVYVACGANGLLLIDATNPSNPLLGSRIATDGDVIGLHTVGGKVWVETARIEARPASALVRAATSAGAVAPSTRPAPGDTTEGSANAAKPASRGLAAPPRHASLWEIHAGTRAFLPIGNIGFGLLGSGSVAYRFDAPVAVYGELTPLGIAGGKQGTIGTAAAHGIVSLDTHLFEIGLGLGAATLNSPSADKATSPSFAQLARIGARDGTAFFGRSNIIVDNDKFAIGSITMTGQFAVSPRVWFMVDGGGGPIGFAYGDLGIRYMLHGDLGPGSFFITGTAGGAGEFKSIRKLTTLPGGTSYYQRTKSADYGGPALGVAFEWRL
ncbi:MAG: hypothetical protein JWM74_2467 [Myxococcaceae bacterium]|nr:hypothetical protein [Myxococcaceae bacterium]